MKNDYKIYFNDSYLLFTRKREQRNKNFDWVMEEEADIEQFLEHPDVLFDGSTNKNILLLTEKPGHWMCHLMERLDVVIAGGGIVWNEQNELLMIHRKGKWDLPKGKVELNENIREGAAREVEEETGVKVQSIAEKPIRTYHAYKMKGIDTLKETSWFEMKAAPAQIKLVPQTKEGITEVRWVKKNEFPKYQKESYLLIADLMSDFNS